MLIGYHGHDPTFMHVFFFLLMNELPKQYRILIIDDFNLDKVLPKNAVKVYVLIRKLNLSHHSQCSTHIYGGILDVKILILFLPCQHLTVIYIFIFYIELSSQQFSF